MRVQRAGRNKNSGKFLNIFAAVYFGTLLFILRHFHL